MTKPVVSAEEFADRRARAVAAAKARQLDGLLVCSRGGGTLDRFADVLYLTNFYTHFPFIPDFEGNWSARAHTFLVLPVDEPPELLIDVPDDGRIRLADGKVTYSDFVIDDAIAALKRAKLDRGRIGLVGGDVLTFTMQNKLRAALPDLELVPADDLLLRLRSIKSPTEIALLRRSSEVGSRMIEKMMAVGRGGRLARRRGGRRAQPPRPVRRHALQLLHGLGPGRRSVPICQKQFPDLGLGQAAGKRRLDPARHLGRGRRLHLRPLPVEGRSGR